MGTGVTVKVGENPIVEKNQPETGQCETGQCEVFNCNSDNKEVFAACPRCLILLCWNHFDNYENCSSHNRPTVNFQTNIDQRIPEDFTIDGGDDQHTPKNPPRTNKKLLAKTAKSKGEQYFSPDTKKTVPPKQIKEPCQYETCKKWGKECFKLGTDSRLEIFLSYYNLGSLQLQREFLARHVESSEKKNW